MINLRSQHGTTLIELLVSAAILSIVLTGFIAGLAGLGVNQVKTRIQSEAIHLNREYAEIAYNLSLQNWDAFANLEGEFIIDFRQAPAFGDTNPFPFYQLEPAPTSSQDRFTRTIALGPAYRDSSGNLTDTSEGATPDPNTRSVTVTTTFTDGDFIEPVVFQTYLTNLRGTL